MWDADAGDLDADLAHFAALFDERLPVVDFGCGDGRQTRFLGRYFATVCGVDISPAAVDRARAADNPANVSFRVLDARDPGEAARLHRELGDVNVYIRGVLQALPLAARPRAVDRDKTRHRRNRVPLPLTPQAISRGRVPPYESPRHGLG